MGYTHFSAERDGLHAEATYLVSPLENVMLWHLELRSDCDRNVTIYPYVELGMMEFMRELQWQCYNGAIVTRWLAIVTALIVHYSCIQLVSACLF